MMASAVGEVKRQAGESLTACPSQREIKNPPSMASSPGVLRASVAEKIWYMRICIGGRWWWVARKHAASSSVDQAEGGSAGICQCHNWHTFCETKFKRRIHKGGMGGFHSQREVPQELDYYDSFYAVKNTCQQCISNLPFTAQNQTCDMDERVYCIELTWRDEERSLWGWCWQERKAIFGLSRLLVCCALVLRSW